jgi:hypothetical protein
MNKHICNCFESVLLSERTVESAVPPAEQGSGKHSPAWQPLDLGVNHLNLPMLISFCINPLCWCCQHVFCEPTSAGLCTLLFCICRPAQVASVVWSFTRMSRLQLPHQQQLMQQRPLVLQLAEASLSSSAAAQELTARQTAVLAWGLHRLGEWAS